MPSEGGAPGRGAYRCARANLPMSHSDREVHVAVRVVCPGTVFCIFFKVLRHFLQGVCEGSPLRVGRHPFPLLPRSSTPGRNFVQMA